MFPSYDSQNRLQIGSDDGFGPRREHALRRQAPLPLGSSRSLYPFGGCSFGGSPRLGNSCRNFWRTVQRSNTLHPNASALFVDFALSAEGSKILAATGRVHRRKGMKSLYEELSDLDERGLPLLVITPEQTEEVRKAMEKIMKELLIK